MTCLFIGKDSGFDAPAFTEQYAKITAKFSEIAGLTYTEQVHGDRACEVTSRVTGVVCAGEGDALFTRLSGQALLIRTADCIPILFYSATQPHLGAVHAGWRGLKAKILSKTLAAAEFGNDLQFVVGPFIGGKSYEVGDDVAGQFAAAFSEPRGNGKFLLDLRKVLEAEFAELGIPPQNIEWHDEDTMTAEEWYSARCGDQRRNLAVIFRAKTFSIR